MTMTKEETVPALIATDPLPTVKFSIVASISEDQEELIHNFSHSNQYAFSPLQGNKKDFKTHFSGY